MNNLKLVSVTVIGYIGFCAAVVMLLTIGGVANATQIEIVSQSKVAGYTTCQVTQNLNGTERINGILGNQNDFYWVRMNPVNHTNYAGCIVSGNFLLFRGEVPVQHNICGNIITSAKKIVETRTVRHVVSKPQLKLIEYQRARIPMFIPTSEGTIHRGQNLQFWGRAVNAAATLGAAEIIGDHMVDAARHRRPSVVTQIGGGAVAGATANNLNQNLSIKGNNNTGVQGANW